MNFKTDKNLLSRAGQDLIVEYRKGYDMPPVYDSKWRVLYDAKVDRIDIGHGSDFSISTFKFPASRWHADAGISRGDMVRIRTDQPKSDEQTIVFQGFITKEISDFFGGTDKAAGHEHYIIACMDYRWLLSTVAPIYGQCTRGPDDFTNYGTPSQAPITNSYTFLSARRAIFNADGRANMDPVDLSYNNADIPLFSPGKTAVPWTAKDMIRYILSPLWNRAYTYIKIDDPAKLTGMDHEDFNSVLSHIVIDSLNIVEALELICKNIGFSFREDYTADGVELVFYEIANATSYVRSEDDTTILHRLHAPAVNEDIAPAVQSGKKMLWQMYLAEDIAAVVNNPWGLGAPGRFEFTAELIPAWLDSDLVPDTSDDNANLFLTEAQLQEITDKNSYDYFRKYHTRGSNFLRSVGRKWTLNEAGFYSGTDYDRGMPFDFSTVIAPQFITDKKGRRLFAPFNRQLLPCLTLDDDWINSVGIKVEFSFDTGATWESIPCSIVPLEGECGIYIEEPNLAEITIVEESTITSGDLEGVKLNLFSSLCDDIVNERIFKDKEWKTRIRVTASVQMDMRAEQYASPSIASGSPFLHAMIYDFSEEYGIASRDPNSSFAKAGKPALQYDHTTEMLNHLLDIRRTNEDMSVSGRFTLERLWLGDGSGFPDFCVGDSIEQITGRNYNLSSALGAGVVYPEIVRISYSPSSQKMSLFTRDLRFAEVTL